MTNETITAAGEEIIPAAAVEAAAEGSTAPDLTAASGAVVDSRRSQRGMVSAEWAVGIIAAIAIAGVLLAVVTSGQVKAALLAFILHLISTFANNAH
jgi:hypothetical protein